MAFFVYGNRNIVSIGVGGMGEKSSKSVENSENERRYFPRWEVKNRVSYRLAHDQQIKECQSRDVNCAGACLSLKEALPVDQHLKLTLYLTDDVSVHVDGKVLWARPNQDDYLIGVSFLSTNEKIQDLILQYAFELKKQDLVKHWFKGWKS